MFQTLGPPVLQTLLMSQSRVIGGGGKDVVIFRDQAHKQGKKKKKKKNSLNISVSFGTQTAISYFYKFSFSTIKKKKKKKKIQISCDVLYI